MGISDKMKGFPLSTTKSFSRDYCQEEISTGGSVLSGASANICLIDSITQSKISSDQRYSIL